MSAILTKVTTGETRVVPTGFSWTTLFFGPFPALFRGDILWAAVIAGSSIVTIGIGYFIWPFFYNGIHLKRLLSKGFAPGSGMGMMGGGQSIQHHVNVHVGNVHGNQPSPQALDHAPGHAVLPAAQDQTRLPRS